MRKEASSSASILSRSCLANRYSYIQWRSPLVNVIDRWRLSFNRFLKTPPPVLSKTILHLKRRTQCAGKRMDPGSWRCIVQEPLRYWVASGHWRLARSINRWRDSKALQPAHRADDSTRCDQPQQMNAGLPYRNGGGDGQQHVMPSRRLRGEYPPR